MSYTKQNFTNGQTLTAAQLNHMEDGIVAVEQAGSAELTIGTVTSGSTASATITNGKLNLVLPKGADGAKGDMGPAGPGFSDTAKALMIDLFTAAAYGSANMQEKVTALKTEWNISGTDSGDDTSTIPGETPVYKLAQAKQFLPENKECVDTGIKLFEDVSAQPTWTILLDADDFGRLQAVAGTYVMLHCMTESDPWPGLCFQITSGGRFQMNLFGRNQPYGYYAGNADAHVKTYVQIKGSQFRAGSDPAADSWGTISGYDTNVPQTLLLGCSQDTSGNKDRYWDGTIERFEVYNKELTNDQIAAWLAQ